jgi:hypothetical protein
VTRRLTVGVFEADGTTVVRNPLTTDRERQCLEELDPSCGAWSLTVPYGSADEAALTPGRMVRFFLDGTAVFSGEIEPSSKVKADSSRRLSGRRVTVSGRGSLSRFEWATLFPELGIGTHSPETRYLSGASKDYSAAGWVAAEELKQQSNPAGPWIVATGPAPDDWPADAGDAWWIGPTGGATPPVDPGDGWFRKVLNVAVGDEGEYRWTTTADDGQELYIDAYRVLSVQGAGLWANTKEGVAYLDPGDHVFYVRLINFNRPNPLTNVAGFVLAVGKVMQGGDEVDYSLGMVSDSSWLMPSFFPRIPPGLTAGKILLILLAEAQARGAGPLTGVAADFTAGEDSNGDPWPLELDEVFPVRTSYLEIIRHLVDEHALEVAFDPAAMTLHAYVTRGQSRVRSRPRRPGPLRRLRGRRHCHRADLLRDRPRPPLLDRPARWPRREDRVQA